jgi:hypothetical protein
VSIANFPLNHDIASIRIIQEAEIRVEMTCMQRSRNLPTTALLFSKGLYIYTLMIGSTTSFAVTLLRRIAGGSMSMEALSSISSNRPGLWQIQQYLVSLVANYTSKVPEFDKLLLHIYLIGLKMGWQRSLKIE